MNYHLLPINFLFLSLLLCFAHSLGEPQNDTHALTQFRLQADAHGYLLPNWTGADACAAVWRGVQCSPIGRVVGVSLPSLSLRGPLDSLSPLSYLRFLDLHDNRLNGTVAPISNCTSLELLYLSGNDLSGEIPPEIASLTRLLRLDLSDNNIRGPIPNELSKLTELLTLRLQNNELSGEIPDLSVSLVNLKELNMTNNEFHGNLPDEMLNRFGDASFSGNAGLCGTNPLPLCSSTIDNLPPLPSSSSGSSPKIPSKPDPLSETNINPNPKSQHRKGLSPGVIVAIVVGNCVVVLVIASFVVAHCCAGGRSSNSSMVGSEIGKRKSGSSYGSEKKVYASGGTVGDSDGTSGTDRSKLVFFDRRSQFELEDLLRASAEMLGKGSLGTVYKAVLDDGCTVAVKRLKDANPCARKEFEQYMDVIGKLKHPNIVRLRAYYYAREEKLLVYDYLPNGNLHSLLHG